MIVLDSVLRVPQSDVTDKILSKFTVTRRYGEPFPLWEEKEDHFTFPVGAYGQYFFKEGFGQLRDLRVKGRLLEETESLLVPREGQAEAVQTVVDCFGSSLWPDHGLLVAGCGKGKALANGEPVLTTVGWVPIGEITTEHRVYGTDGRDYPVLGVFPQSKRRMLRVLFTDGTSVLCDEDHLWTFVKRRSTGKPVVTITARELSKQKIRGSAGRRFFLPEQSPIQFIDSPRLPLDSYTLGALLGDGHLSIPGTVKITTEDLGILDELVLPLHHRVKKTKQQNAGNATTYALSQSIQSRNKYGVDHCLHNILDRLGLMGKTSHFKFIPDVYKRASIEERVSLLQGLFDTDGTPTASGVVEYTTVSQNLRDGVYEVALSLGGTCSCRTKKTELNGKVFLSYRLLVKLPKMFKSFRLERKQSKMEVKRQREPYRAVEAVRLASEYEATCISVGSPDKLFLTRNFVPTHNTIMGTEIARIMRRPTCILVHKEYLGEQWAEAIEILVPKASIGYVRQDRCDTGNDHDFVIASTQSITSATRVYSSEFYDSFGVMLFDEVHRYGANVWHQVLQKFPAKYRLGLTATAKRFDGLWPVITSHLGEVYHELDSDPMTFKVYTLEIKSGISRKAFNFDWMDDKMRRAKIISLIAKHDFRNTVIARNLKKAYDASRNVIIISDRKEQLKTLMMKCQELGASSDDMGLFVGGMKKKDRDRAVSNPLIFTTYGMSQEGLDIERLDALFLASPRAHIEQTVGRILRQFEGKNMPVVVDPVDVDIDEAKGWAYSRLKEYEALGAEVEGNFRR
jgi:hypothetical protein